jgi:hypothetical protein
VSKILAYTTTYGSRPYLAPLIPEMRGAAGCWFDWNVYVGAPSAALRADASDLLKPDGSGIQRLTIWPENRGQWHATADALAQARADGYTWLLRIDDDITPKTKRWLKKMIDHLDELKRLAGDDTYRFVASPKVMGLNNPLTPKGTVDKGQSFSVDVMAKLGGACRLHPVELLDGWEPPIYDPIGRGDPEAIAGFIEVLGGYCIRFPHIKVVHNTARLEEADTPEEAHQRRMAKFFPFLGATV